MLGDGVAGARYVANVLGRGYCFVAPILAAPDVDSQTSVAAIGHFRLGSDDAARVSAALTDTPHEAPASVFGLLVKRDNPAPEIMEFLHDRGMLIILDGLESVLVMAARSSAGVALQAPADGDDVRDSAARRRHT